ncbi:MAG TPA: hypothetical protein QGF35_01835 [Dehalococcoidia bacterium]|nr:hypothetical protein [Dehalococcoidia bacterium]
MSSAVPRFDIEDDGPLVSVIGPEIETVIRVHHVVRIGTRMAGPGTTLGFDQNDVRPQITKNLTAELAATIGQVNDSIGRKHLTLRR